MSNSADLLTKSPIGRIVLNTPEAVRAEACRRSLFTFIQEFWDVIIDEKPVFNWHIPYICGLYEDVLWRVMARQRKTHDLIINIPPGTTKTTVLSIMAPAWSWIARMPVGLYPIADRLAAAKAPEGTDPRPSGANLRFISGSYASDIALKMSSSSRDVIASDRYRRYFPEICLRDDTSAKSDYANTLKGSRFTTSIKSRVMGVHGHVIIYDDPIDPEQALSDIERLRANEAIDNVRTRAVDKRLTPLIVVQQRLHEDDTTAHLLRTAKSVMHVRLPATDEYEIYPPELKRYYDDACGLLDPIRIDDAVITDNKRILGAYKYAGQFGQDPRPREGGMFPREKFEIVDAAPEGGVEVRGWDLAASKKDRSNSKQAATAGVKIKIIGARIVKGGLAGGTIYVLHDFNMFGEGDKVRKSMRAVATQDGPGCIQDLPQDPGQAGKSQVKDLVANLQGFPVRYSLESGDKVLRADPIASQCQAGNIKLVRGAWNQDFIDEISMFPNGRKDRTDALVRAYNRALKLAAVEGDKIGGAGGVANPRKD